MAKLPIVDASTQGRIDFFMYPDVITQNHKPEIKQKTAGFIAQTTNNMDTLNKARGKTRMLLKENTFTKASSLIRDTSGKAIAGLKEQARGVYLDTVS